MRSAKTQISLGIHSVWSESSLCTQWVAKGPMFLHADSEDSDQTGRMPRLIWVFAGAQIILLVFSWGCSFYDQSPLKICGRTQGGHPHAETKFPDFSLTKFSFSLTKIWCFYDLAADKWQIPFTSSLKCTSLTLQMKQIKSLNSFLAQRVLKLTSFHSLERSEQEKKSTLFSHFK